jgi:hypothetical protein
MILPLPLDNLLDGEYIKIVDILLNIDEQLGDESLLVVNTKVDFKLIIFHRSVSKGTLEVFLKWDSLFHKTFQMLVHKRLVQQSSLISLTHELH